MKDYYKILDIKPDASLEEIKKACRIMAVRFHPEKIFGNTEIADKLTEVKEAYQLFTDAQRKKQYDDLYKSSSFKAATRGLNNIETSKQGRGIAENYYLFGSRATQDTSDEFPQYDHWGNKLDAQADLFARPKRIGRLISGYTSLSIDDKPYTLKQLFVGYSAGLLCSLLIAWLIVYVFGISAVQIKLLTLGIVSALVLGIVYSYTIFRYECNYMGVNGFAQFKCKGSREKISESWEVNFNDLSDLFKTLEVGGSYYTIGKSRLSYTFAWLNDRTVINQSKGTFEGKQYPDHSESKYWLHAWAEKYWTIYLLDRMEKELEQRGYLEFSTMTLENKQYVKVPFMHVGVDYMRFFKDEGETLYHNREIKRVHREGDRLVFEHQNNEKPFYFFDTGDSFGVDLSTISNALFLIKSLEILLGPAFA